jgi:YihY family inner membrane protein
MSTASFVPETYELEGDDARETLRRFGRMKLAKDAFQRFRAADGFSHSRALAFQVMLTALPALIALVAFTTVVNQDDLRRIVERTLVGLAPGPASRVLTQAFDQGTSSGTTALWVGLLAALLAGTTAMGQLERGANRIYGVEADRPTLRKYGLGFVLAITSGLFSVAAFVLLVGGGALRSAGKATGWSDTFLTVWALARWPVGIILAVGAMALFFKKSPSRNQPAWSWLAYGSAVSALLWLLFTGLLSLYLTASKSFGQTYGPLAGTVGALVWAFLTSLAIYLGIAFAAQLEAVRAGVPVPKTGDERNEVPAKGRALT